MTVSSLKHLRFMLGSGLLLAVLTPAWGEETAVNLRERFPAGYQYRVSTRVELSGTLTLPLEKGQTVAKKVNVTGRSSIDYEERVLAHDKDGRVDRTFRVYDKLDFERRVADQLQHNALRPVVRRLVLLRHHQLEVPFSPDGPLTWGEIDLVRCDVFTPALAGLLPQRAVQVGERWEAAATAVQELTDLERLDEGGLTCTLVQFSNLANRRHARIDFRGTVRGIGEDGPNRHQLDGTLWFDLEAQALTYVSMRGKQALLDKDGKASGEVEGTFVLTRQPVTSRQLGDDIVRALRTEPNDENTQLLFEDPALGVRMLYPRRWHVAGVRGNQLAVDEKKGSGFLLTIEPAAKVPGARQFLDETRNWFMQQKATVLRADGPWALSDGLENFTLEVEAQGQRFLMDYYVIHQAAGGATLAARLLPNDATDLRTEVRRIAQGVQITGKR